MDRSSSLNMAQRNHWGTSPFSSLAPLALVLCLSGCPAPRELPAFDSHGNPGCTFEVKTSSECFTAVIAQKCKLPPLFEDGNELFPAQCRAFECEGMSNPSPPNPFTGTKQYCQDTGINPAANLVGLPALKYRAEPPLLSPERSDRPSSDFLSAIVRGTTDFEAMKVKRATSVVAVSISEFPLSRPGVLPGPIISAGQRLVFGSAAAPCRDPCDIFQIDTTGKITPMGVACTNSDFCRHTGLAPTSDGGFCYTTVEDRYPLGPPNNGAAKPDRIVCTTPGGEFSHSLHILSGFVAGIALGGDGRIWYVDTRWNGIGRVDVPNPGKVQADYVNSNFLGFASIAKGPDAAMWFTAANIGQVGRMSANGLQILPLPTKFSGPAGITAGPDGNIWVTQLSANKIARITPAGVVTEFPLPTANAQPLGIAPGPDGALWFTEYNANKIGRITVFGEITEYPIPTAQSQPAGIVAGPDGNMWFTEFKGNKIGRVTLSTSAQAQVIEFYNTILDNYFITANAAEQAAIDSGSAGPGWRRTGGQFASGGTSTVCRFYGSLSPGPNSHFYTASPNECAALKQLQVTTPASQKRWNFESNDFSTTPPVNGACAAGLTPVYRAYNNGFSRGADSNHRIVPSTVAIAEVVARGWVSEGLVMCAP